MIHINKVSTISNLVISMFLVLCSLSCKERTKEYNFSIFNNTVYDLDIVALNTGRKDDNCNLSIPANDTLTNIVLKIESTTNFVNDDAIWFFIKEYSLGEDDFTNTTGQGVATVEDLSTLSVNLMTVIVNPTPDNSNYIFDVELQK